jgi:hypothetical protein
MCLIDIYKEINNEKITSIEGVESYVYEVIPPDIEQKNDEDLNQFINLIISFLNQLPSLEHWFKVYVLGERIIINSTLKDLSIPFCKMNSISNYFESLINGSDFFSEVTVSEDYVHFNSTYLRLINLYEMPKVLGFSELQALGDLALNFRKVDSEISKRKIHTQRRLHHANLYKSMRNLESEASFQEAEKLTESMMMGEEQVFEVEGWIILKDKSLEGLNLKTSKLIDFLKQREIIFLIESVGLTSLFPMILFGIEPSFKRAHDCPSSYLSHLLPFKKDQLMNDGYCFDSRSGASVKFQLFNPESLNFNALFTGVSGAGKSMCAQKIVSEEINLGAKAIILDLGNSFDKLARFNGANIFSTKNSPGLK